MKRSFLGIVLFHVSSVFAAGPMHTVYGAKHPENVSEGDTPVYTTAWTRHGDVSTYPGFTDLLPYVVRSPHQQDAGSCLYMSLTGAAEMLLAQRNPNTSTAPDGPLDLSERYLMNLAGVQEDGNGVDNWKTDSIYLLNIAGALPLNTGYRFTKGWVTKNAAGEYAPADPGMIGATYDTRYNWLNEMSRADLTTLVPLPRFEREVLFADPASDQWNTGVMPEDIVDRIRVKLRERRAPVHVIYNHYGYWHAADIVGYDDDADTMGCTFVTKFITSMHDKAVAYRLRAETAPTDAERLRLIKLAEKSERVALKTKAAFDNGGGCHPKGMFYVRDSIYTDKTGPIYDYDPAVTGDEGPYSKPIVLHEYDWVRYMANHASQIYVR